MSKYRLLSLAMVVLSFAFALTSCGGGGSDDNGGGTSSQGGGNGSNDSGDKSVTTEVLSTTGLEAFQVTVNCKVTAPTAPTVQNVGVVIGTNAKPTILNCDFNVHPASLNGTSYSATVVGLRPGTTYYSCSYYYDGTQIKYGNVRSFTTPVAAVSAVDLGLSSATMWSASNVGAEDPTVVGLYFEWGATVPMTVASSSSAKAMLRNVGEINGNPIGDLAENLLQLDPAYVYLGKDWRTPSASQLEELRKECTWTWCDGVNVKYNGSSVKGYKVESKVNSNSIFLPVTGYCDKGSLRNSDVGYYRSRLEVQIPPENGEVLYFTSSNKGSSQRAAHEGCVIRPVKAFDK